MTNRPFVDPNDRYSYEDWMNETAADVQDELPMPPVGHPLHKLGERLAHYLDDDKFNECEALLLEGWDHDRIDRRSGQHWREDSSLDVWFPFSAEELERLKRERDELAQALQDFIDYQISDYHRMSDAAKQYCELRRKARALLSALQPAETRSAERKEGT